jgi:hypothetical protein
MQNIVYWSLSIIESLTQQYMAVSYYKRVKEKYILIGNHWSDRNNYNTSNSKSICRPKFQD